MAVQLRISLVVLFVALIWTDAGADGPVQEPVAAFDSRTVLQAGVSIHGNIVLNIDTLHSHEVQLVINDIVPFTHLRPNDDYCARDGDSCVFAQLVFDASPPAPEWRLRGSMNLFQHSGKLLLRNQYHSLDGQFVARTSLGRERHLLTIARYSLVLPFQVLWRRKQHWPILFLDWRRRAADLHLRLSSRTCAVCFGFFGSAVAGFGGDAQPGQPPADRDRARPAAGRQARVPHRVHRATGRVRASAVRRSYGRERLQNVHLDRRALCRANG